MEGRRASVEETRRRIVEATLELHSRKGIFGTSWREIAARADVSVATVYKHFPTLDELVPACGALILARTDPPMPEDAARSFEGAEDLRGRVGRLVAVFLDFYERAGAYLEVGPQERRLPAVREWEMGMRYTREAYAREALGEAGDEDAARTVGALLDYGVYRSLVESGIGREESEAILREMVLCWLAGRGR